MFNIFDYIHSIKKLFSRKDVLIVLVLVLFYFAIRLINLDTFPIFSDEGIYIHWAKVAWKDASWRFISLTDGKQPLQTWGTISLLKVFSENALLAGRLFSTLTGLFGLSGIFAISYYLWGKKAAFISGFLYIITPYFLFYDRMALVDSGVNAFAIWILFLSIVFARTIRLDVALIYGLLSGMALLAKSSVRIFLGMGLLAGLFFTEGKKKGSKLFNFFVLYVFSVLIAFVIYNVQRLSPFFHFVAQKNTTFIVTFAEFKAAPFALLSQNLKNIPYFVFSEMGYVVGFVGLFGLWTLFKNERKLALYLAAWIVIPYIMIASVSKVLFPRYIIFFGSLLVLLASYAIAKLNTERARLAVLLAIVVSMIFFDYALLFDFKNTPFPQIDRGQYIEGWPAGWGTREIVSQARDVSQRKPVVLIGEGNFGMSGDVLDTHLKPGDNISIKGYWPLDLAQLQENQALLKDNAVFVVFSHRREFPQEWPLKLIQKYDKPGDESEIYFFELTR